MEFTRNEKLAILRICDPIIMADNIFSSEEQMFMLKLLSEFKLTLADAKENSKNLDIESAAQILISLNREQKTYAKNLFVSLAIVDKNLDPDAASILTSLFKLLN